MINSRNISLVHKIPADKPASFLSDRYLFVICKQKCAIFDVSNKAQPSHLSDIELTKDKSDTGTFFSGLLNGKAYFDIGYDCVDVFDLQDSRNPKHLGVINNFSLAKSCSLNKNLLLTLTNKTALYDMADPLRPAVVFDFEKRATDFLIAGNHLFMADPVYGIDAYDISNPTVPVKVANLKIDAARIFRSDDKTLIGDGKKYELYFLDISSSPNISLKSQVRLKGPMIFLENNYLFSRLGRTTPGDTIYGYRLQNLKPKQIFSTASSWVTNQVVNGPLLLLQGIKGYDGVSPLPNYTKQRYSIFEMKDEKVEPLGTIGLEGIFFSSIHILDKTIYIARPDGIYVYQV
jgi:hypothetical protein